jgi:hypothetical protein
MPGSIQLGRERGVRAGWRWSWHNSTISSCRMRAKYIKILGMEGASVKRTARLRWGAAGLTDQEIDILTIDARAGMATGAERNRRRFPFCIQGFQLGGSPPRSG